MIDEWQLPVTERAGTCEVSVQLAPFSLPEAGSWEEIKGVVSRLGEECRRRGALGDVTGGEIRVGVHERILVEMVRS